LKRRIHLVPTFHYDLAYLMSFEEYFPRLNTFFTEMLNIMEERDRCSRAGHGQKG